MMRRAAEGGAEDSGLEERVRQLEEELKLTRVTLRKTLVELEKHLAKDIDGDGKTG